MLIAKNPNIYVDLSLVSEPITKDKMLELSLNSTVYSDIRSFVVQRDVVIPHSAQSTKQIQIYLSENVLNSILISLKDTDRLDLNIPSELTNLNTTSIGTFIPNIIETYGKDQMVNILCKTINYPKLTLSNDKVDSSLNESITFNVLMANGTVSSAIEFQADLSFSSKFNLEKGYAKAEILNFSINQLNVIKSNIGIVDPSILKSTMNLLITYTILPFINSILKTGFDLPSLYGLLFTDAFAYTKDGYLLVEMNPHFSSKIKRFLNFIE